MDLFLCKKEGMRDVWINCKHMLTINSYIRERGIYTTIRLFNPISTLTKTKLIYERQYPLRGESGRRAMLVHIYVGKVLCISSIIKSSLSEPGQSLSYTSKLGQLQIFLSLKRERAFLSSGATGVRCSCLASIQMGSLLPNNLTERVKTWVTHLLQIR